MKTTQALSVLFCIAMVGCSKKDSTVSPNGQMSFTVSGRVVDYYGQPMGSTPILITGKPVVATLADGSFSVMGVTAPYTASIILSGEAIVYEGLTRSDPVLRGLASTAVTEVGADIGGTAPPAQGMIAQIVFVPAMPLDGLRAVGGGVDASGAFAISPRWLAAPTSMSIHGRLYLTQYVAGSRSEPLEFTGFALRDVTLEAAQSLRVDFTAVDLIDPADERVAGEIIIPSGAVQYWRNISLVLDGFALGVGWDNDPTSSSFSFLVPAISGATFHIYAAATDSRIAPTRFMNAGVEHLLAPATGVSIAIPASPVLLLPPNLATQVNVTTPFSWVPGAENHVAAVRFTPARTQEPGFVVFTAGTSARVPDLSSVGLGLPGGSIYHWGVTEYGALSSVDSAASFAAITKEHARIGTFATSAPYSFTTGP